MHACMWTCVLGARMSYNKGYRYCLAHSTIIMCILRPWKTAGRPKYLHHGIVWRSLLQVSNLIYYVGEVAEKLIDVETDVTAHSKPEQSTSLAQQSGSPTTERAVESHLQTQKGENPPLQGEVCVVGWFSCLCYASIWLLSGMWCFHYSLAIILLVSSFVNAWSLEKHA